MKVKYSGEGVVVLGLESNGRDLAHVYLKYSALTEIK